MNRRADLPSLADLDFEQMATALAAELSRFTELLQGNIPRARQALKKLLVDKVVFTPVEQGNGKQTYAFRAELTYGAILEEHIYSKGVPSGIRTRGIPEINS